MLKMIIKGLQQVVRDLFKKPRTKEVTPLLYRAVRGIVIITPEDPRVGEMGLLQVVERTTSGVKIVDAFPCYTRADHGKAKKMGNPSASPLYPYGDLPSGRYFAIVGTVRTPERSYGRYPVIALSPMGGHALHAVKKNGRWGLSIHGGDLDKHDKLRATYGCTRIHDAHQRRLIRWIEASTSKVFVEVVYV